MSKPTAVQRSTPPSPTPHIPPPPLEFLLSTEQIHKLESFLGTHLKDETDLLDAVEAMTNISVEGVKIRIEPGLLHRLRSRCIRREFDDFLRETVVQQLHSFVGW